MHRRSLLASEKRTASAERPILSSSKGQGLASSNNSRTSAAPAFITRSNNPYNPSSNKQENSKQEISKPKTRRSRSTGKQKETSDSSSTETSWKFCLFFT